MKFRFAALAAFAAVSAGILAQDTPLSEGGVFALDATLEPLALQYGIRFTFDLESVPKPVWEQGMRRVYESEFKHSAFYLDVFAEEFAKYPYDFIKESGLKAVVFCAGLDIGGQVRKAVPDYVNETLYLDIHALAGKSDRYARHVVHHEFYHMLEEQWNGSAYYKDPKWAALNPPDWKYGSGGARMQSGNVWDFNHPAPGFINAYSTAALEEDKAEVWATMFVPESWEIIRPWLKTDKILQAKVDFLKSFAAGKSSHMKPAFWNHLTAKPLG